MKFTLSWLKDYLDTTASLAEISVKLTAIGLEVEGIHDPAKALAGFVVGHVVECAQHPDADRLRCLVVDTGAEKLKVVCGAPNARLGMKGVFAPAGSFIPGSGITLKKTSIRGAESNGMMCSGKELMISDDHDGIIELPDSAVAGSSAAAALGLDDPVIEINLTPNRGDCAGVFGIARDLAAAGLGKLKHPAQDSIAGTFKNPISITLNPIVCPHFIGRYIRGVKNGASPKWLQDRLKAVGQKPISALVDITNYLTLALNRPAHVFDADKLKGNIHVRWSKEGETLEALNDKTYTLDHQMIVVCDDSGVLGLGGIIGGKASAVDENTQNVYLEIAYFDPSSIAKTGQKLQIDSDARYRFERGVDPAFAETGADIATRLILESCGGEASNVFIAGAAPTPSKTIAYNPARLQTLGGSDLSETRQKEILAALGFSLSSPLPLGEGGREARGEGISDQAFSSEMKKYPHPNPLPEGEGRLWCITSPSWRHDVEGEADIVEEILRIDGYDNIPAQYIKPVLGEKRAALNPLQKRIATTRRLLAARGLRETVTWSFMESATADLFGANDTGHKAALTLVNPISIDLAVMRPSILPNLIEATGRNADKGMADACLFEIGNIYKSTDSAGQVAVAAGLRSGDAAPRHWSQLQRKVDAMDAKADAFAVLEACGVNMNGVQITTDAPAWYHPGRSGVLRQGNVILACFGEIHPAVMAQLKREEATAAFEVFLQSIAASKKKTTRRELLKPSPFQPLSRDFAFIVDEKMDADTLLRAVKAADKSLIASVNVFDVYMGKGVEHGKKSIALSVMIQPVEKTLTEDDIHALSRRVIDNVAKQTQGVLRG